MKNLIGVALLLMVPLTPVLAEQPDRPPLTVTYVGNEGFLVESGGKKVLIDALFGGFEADWCVVPPDSIVNLMSTAQPPFDDIDIVAITHAHADHFNPEIGTAHMQNNADGIMICPPQVTDRMASVEGYAEIEDRLRIIPAPGDSAIKISVVGIRIEVLPTLHGVSMRTDTLTGETYDRHRDIQHLEYLIEVNGRKLYHSGDSPQYDYNKDGGRRFNLNQQSVDVAFLQWWGEWSELSRRQKWAREILRPDRIIFMHLRPGRQIPDQPPEQRPAARELIIPVHSMQRWLFE